MRLGTAIEHLVEAYKYASDKEWIQDKAAWALYHTWKDADRKDEPTTQIETQNSNLTFEKADEPTGYNLSPVETEPQTDCAWR